MKGFKNFLKTAANEEKSKLELEQKIIKAALAMGAVRKDFPYATTKRYILTFKDRVQMRNSLMHLRDIVRNSEFKNASFIKNLDKVLKQAYSDKELTISLIYDDQSTLEELDDYDGPRMFAYPGQV